MERLGILGGTFDPVHVAHLAAAAAARDQLALDRVLVVVAGDPWQKRERDLAPAEVRYEMVAAALEAVDGLVPSRLEIDRTGPTYTIDTVETLLRGGGPEGAGELFLVVGSDVAASLDTWHRSADLRDAVTLAIVDREDVAPSIPPAGWRSERVHMPRLDVSSTDLRRRIAAGESVDFLVPPPRGADPARTRSLHWRVMTRARSTTPERRRRRRELLGVVGIVVLAAGSGLVASQLGTRRSWENTSTTSTTHVPSIDPQGNP